MKKIESFFEKMSDITHYYSKKCLIFIVGVMVSVILLQVFFRYIVGAPLIWPEEMTTFLMAWMSFIGSAVALKKWEHLGIEFLVNILPGKLHLLVKIIGKLAVAFFIVVFTYQSIFLVMQSTHQVSMAMQVSMVYPRLSLTIGGFLMLIHLIYFLIKDFNQLVLGGDN